MGYRGGEATSIPHTPARGGKERYGGWRRLRLRHPPYPHLRGRKMAILPQDINEYLDGLVPGRPAEMQAMEAYAREHKFPIIGPASGYLCYQIARMVGARRIFELGSGYGYSTAWFARAVQENLALSGVEAGGGEVHHVVWSEELSQKARGHLSKLGY